MLDARAHLSNAGARYPVKRSHSADTLEHHGVHMVYCQKVPASEYPLSCGHHIGPERLPPLRAFSLVDTGDILMSRAVLLGKELLDISP
jgi:hypothetical protein